MYKQVNNGIKAGCLHYLCSGCESTKPSRWRCAQVNSVAREQRILLMLRKQLCNDACPNSVVESALTHVFDNILTKTSSLRTCDLQPISQLHVNAANACKYGILQALLPVMPKEALVQVQCHGDLDLNTVAQLLSMLDENSIAWLTVQNLMSFQLFHLRRASAVDKEFLGRQLQQIAEVPSSKACGMLIPAGCRCRSARRSRSFELQLPVVDELVALM